MVRRHSITKFCRRAKYHKHDPKKCYYCWRKILQDSRFTLLRPEEYLLAIIFGEGRFFQVRR